MRNATKKAIAMNIMRRTTSTPPNSANHGESGDCSFTSVIDLGVAGSTSLLRLE